MAQYAIKQSTTTYPLVFLLVSSSDHIAGATGLTPTVKLSKAGATGVSPSGAIAEVDATNMPGWYKVAGNATDSGTLGPLVLHATAAGADPVDVVYEVVAYEPRTAATDFADALLARDVSNVEATAPEHSLATIVLATTEWAISGTTWTIYRTNGVTTHVTKTLAATAGANPITSVN